MILGSTSEWDDWWGQSISFCLPLVLLFSHSQRDFRNKHHMVGQWKVGQNGSGMRRDNIILSKLSQEGADSTVDITGFYSLLENCILFLPVIFNIHYHEMKIFEVSVGRIWLKACSALESKEKSDLKSTSSFPRKVC